MATICLYAKLPRPGCTKSRLARDIGDEAAAALSEAMLRDLACELRNAADSADALWLWHPPGDDPAAFPPELAEFARAAQKGEDLGERMLHTMRTLLPESGKVIIIGSDCITLDRPTLRAAIAALDNHDLVLQPADDGGYTLIGMSRLCSEVFADIVWGSAEVWDQTMARVADAGISCHTLPVTFDVDTVADLATLGEFLRTHDRPRTAAQLRALQPAKRIISLGEVLWDLFPDRSCFGGAPANMACHAARQGATVTMISAVGSDPRGDEALQILDGFGIDLTLVQRSAEFATGSVGVSLDDAGKPSFEIHENAAWDQLGWDAEFASRITEADAVYFGTLGQRSEPARNCIRQALEVAESAGLPRVLDVNLRAPYFDADMIRESIALASILKLSDDELETVCAACGVRTLSELREAQGLDWVVMTRGADGALLVTAAETVNQPGITTVVRDTVGAGDSFTAAFILGLLHGDAPATILRQACEIASAVCAQDGAVPSVTLPST
jgi:fructokinase